MKSEPIGYTAESLWNLRTPLVCSFLAILSFSGCGHNPEDVDAAKKAEPVSQATNSQTGASVVVAKHSDGAVKTNVVTPQAIASEPKVETSDTTIKEIVALLKETGNVEHARKRIGAVIARNDKAVDEAVALLATEPDPDIGILIVSGMVDAGTEKAIDALLGLFSQMPDDNATKRQIGDAIIQVTNPACADVLLEAVLSGDDPSDVADIAQRALGNIADNELLNKIEQLYYSAQDDSEKQRLADTVRHAQGTNLVQALISLSDPPEASRSESIAVAACDTLGIIGTPEATLYLLARISSAQAGATDPALDSLARVRNTDSLPVLLQAARGHGGMTASARVAAIAALKNFDTDTVGTVLEEIARTTADSRVLDAAEVSLAAIRQTPTR
jgi:hypothetical protein